MDEMRFNKPVTPEIPEEKKRKNNSVNWKIWQKVKKQNIFITVIFLVIIILVGTAANFYLKAKKLQLQSQMPTAGEVQKIVEEVSKLIVLPNDEEPTVATISDAEKLKSQPFFVNAKNGDKVLIYAKARKAILYDPIAKKIVEVAPLNSSSASE